MLILHRSERADRLVDALGGLLSEPLADPVTAEVVSVPTRGVERWITQRLSHHLGTEGTAGGGVCANLAFPFPGTLVGRAMARATGIEASEDPWAPERAVWPLIDVLDAHSGDPRLAPIVQHLRAATPGSRDGEEAPPRRFGVARHLADLFDRYAVHRPEMLRAWAASPGTEGWQPHLWRLLRSRIGIPSPAERLPPAVDLISRDAVAVDLPERLSVFGLTRLPAGHLQVLSALARNRDVHLFLLHPSGCLWDRVEAALPAGAGVMARRQDPTRRLPTSPLLRSWGRDAREMQVVLAAHGLAGGRHYPVEPAAGEPPPTLLRRIQDDIVADRAPATDRPELRPEDESLRIYSCHGRGRQVEVLRDALLHLLQGHPDLEARDVIVMCPDIEAFAPLIQATFGVAEEAEGGAVTTGGLPQLRVRLADRSLRQTNPLLSVAGLLLDLAASRVAASAVLDLAARPPVARRFGFDRDELSTIESWVADTGVHWGFDAEHRARWGLGRVPENTWSSGLDRLALGVAMADTGSRVFARTVPYADLPSTSVELSGRLAEMVSRLRMAVAGLSGRRPLREWTAALSSGTENLAAAAPGETWQLDQLRRTLAEAVDEAGDGPGADAALGLEEVRSLLAGRLAGRPTRANFRTGDLTFCTLVPMRSVPHRVVALLGLDDGAFPRHPEPDGDDLLVADPQVGDREARAEDRQLVLDALLAATDHLIVTYSGRDERTNRPRPPCAPVAELLDVVDATVRTAGGDPARRTVVVEHPLQPFDPRNFTEGALGRPGAWSFDPVHLDGARHSRSQHPRRPWLEGRLPPLAQPVLQLEDIIHFVQHPVRAFLRQRLSLFLTDREVDISDSLPLELDALQKWAVGDRMLEAGLAGVPTGQAARAEERRGLLPPSSIASPILEDVQQEVDGILSAMSALGFAPGPAASCLVRIELPDGRLLVGSVPNVRDDTVVQCVYSRLAAKHRLAAWVRFLALTADRPDQAVRALSVGKGQRANPVSVARLEPVPGPPGSRQQWALDRLEGLVRLYDIGMREPLPLVCKTSAAWAEGRRDRLDQPEMLARAQQHWDSAPFARECDEDEHVYVYGRAYPFLSLLQDGPTEEDRRLGWPHGERSRFGGLSRLLWDPLLEVEEVGG